MAVTSSLKFVIREAHLHTHCKVYPVKINLKVQTLCFKIRHKLELPQPRKFLIRLMMSFPREWNLKVNFKDGKKVRCIPRMEILNKENIHSCFPTPSSPALFFFLTISAINPIRLLKTENKMKTLHPNVSDALAGNY